MKEDFLHFIWQFQKFNHRHLQTTDREEVCVLAVGNHNYDAGPDFLNAKLRIGNVTWSGAVEIHINASDWTNHQHQKDPGYDSVILHVVWNHDRSAFRHDGSIIPVVVLADIVSSNVLHQYEQLFEPSYDHDQTLVCENHLQQINEMTMVSAMETALVARLMQKGANILALLDQNKGDWQVTIYQWLCRGFGFNKNTEPMQLLASAVPYRVMRKEQDQIIVLFAMYLGQANLIDKVGNDNAGLLYQQYAFLNIKYGLQEIKPSKMGWKFFRMRPANFPTVRIQQLAWFLHHFGDRLQNLIDLSLDQIVLMFNSITDEKSEEKLDLINNLGKNAIEYLLINVVIPLKYAHAQYFQDSSITETVIEDLEKINAEKNQLVSSYKKKGFPVKTAFDSQAIIELNKSFCRQKKCMSCKIGLKLLQSHLDIQTS